MLAGNELRQIAPPLLIIAVTANLIDAQVRMRAIGKADGGRGSRNLLHGHAMREITEPGATPFLFDCNPQKAERPTLMPQLAGEAVGPVDLIGARRDFRLRKVAHRIAKHFDIAAKAEIEPGQTVR